ncbi:transposase, IS4 family [Wolbachia endosymbiont of Armadillidium vulgare str. wVulC]|nr:transposase, IS4 family [Wolbachia endosymbiont of Armadillidium vulgare str. wVulC]
MRAIHKIMCYSRISRNDYKTKKEHSLTKAFIELKRWVRELFLILNNIVSNLKIFLKKLTVIWSKFSLKDRYRKTRVSTLSSLHSLT